MKRPRLQRFRKRTFFSLIYGTPYNHTPTGLVERAVRTLKENLLTNVKAGQSFNLALEVMRTTPPTRIKEPAFELHFGRNLNTELSNMLNLNNQKS